MSTYASPEEYNLADLLCCAASREVQDNEIVFAGTGLPMVAAISATSDSIEPGVSTEPSACSAPSVTC